MILQRNWSGNTIKATKGVNAFLDARSNVCYTAINVEQDHNFDGDRCRAFHGSGWLRRAIMHPFQRGRPESLSAKLLR
jgi:hypothetical protein